jgi:hypothetical protein
MGLLDDAIREHLEFKRLRGADPSEVAREEHAALGRVPREDEDLGALKDLAAPDSRAIEDDSFSNEADQAVEPGFSHAGQETAELDMKTVLEVETNPSTTGPELGKTP